MEIIKKIIISFCLSLFLACSSLDSDSGSDKETFYTMFMVIDPMINDPPHHLAWSDPNQDVVIRMSSVPWYTYHEVVAHLHTKIPRKVLFIREVSFHIDNEKYFILKNVKKRFLSMYQLKSGFYSHSGIKVGKLYFDRLLKDKLKVGYEIEVMVTQIYTFDNGKEQIRTEPYIIKCFERRKRRPWYLDLGWGD
jgi:hypothetical protein